jgi:putative redox protein
VIKSERLTFPGATGDQLAARLDHGGEEPRAYALFAHCFTCSKDLKAVSRISRALVRRGIAVLRFDFTGLGESEGEFAETDFSSNLEDLLAAAETLRQKYRAPELLIGHSLGGAAVLVAASEVPEAVAVATLGAPSDTQHLRDTLLSSAPELADEAEAQVTLAGRSFRIRRQLLEDLDRHKVLPAVGELDRALLVCHSPVDEVVDVDHARRIFEAARHPKSYLSLGQADHLLLRDPEDARWIADMLAAWASRYLENAADMPQADEPLPHGVVEVRGGDRGFEQVIRAGSHRWVGDEPESVGGGDAGPTPYDLLLAALGTCTNMTLRMYADRKDLGLTGVDTRLRHQRVHARDCEDCASKTGKIDRIDREITLHGDLDETQRKRLMEIADRCPVHRTLTSETVIRSVETVAAETRPDKTA